MAKRVGIKDVAALAGVSPATVSRALSDHLSDTVASGTRERVFAAAESLDYSANRMAIAIQRGRTSLVGMVVDDLADAYIAGRMIDGAQRALWNRDVLLTVTSAAGGPKRVQRVLKKLYEQPVDGVIFAATVHQVVDVAGKCPVVLLNSEPRSGGTPCVIADDMLGADTAVTELLYAGHKRIGFVGPDDPMISHRKFSGYQRALNRVGLPLNPDLVVVDDAPTNRGGQRNVARLLRGLVRPTALICATKAMAIGAYQAAADHDRQVPRDLSIIAFDSDDPAGPDSVSPPLTTVAVPHFEMGSHAAQIITRLMDGPSCDPDERTLVPYYLNRRFSVAEPA